MKKQILLFKVILLLTLGLGILGCEKDDEDTTTTPTLPTTGTIKAEGVDGDSPGWGLSGIFYLYKGTDNVYASSSIANESVEDYGEYAYFRNLRPGSYKLKFEFNPGNGYDGSNSFAVEAGKTTYIRLTYSWGGNYSWYYTDPE